MTAAPAHVQTAPQNPQEVPRVGPPWRCCVEQTACRLVYIACISLHPSRTGPARCPHNPKPMMCAVWSTSYAYRFVQAGMGRLGALACASVPSPAPGQVSSALSQWLEAQQCSASVQLLPPVKLPVLSPGARLAERAARAGVSTSVLSRTAVVNDHLDLSTYPS
jgi:hypothetical protein